MRAVNLMPRDERRARLETGRMPLLIAAGGIVVVTAAFVFLASSASGSAGDSKAAIAEVEAAIADLPRAPDSAVSQGTLIQERSDRVAALAAALATRVSFDRVLREISFVFPANAWLTRFEATAPTIAEPVPEGAAPPPVPTASPQGVTIEGATYSHDAVAIVLARLAVVPSLENVRLSGTALVDPRATDASGSDPQPQPTVRRGRPFVTFVVTASLKTGVE